MTSAAGGAACDNYELISKAHCRLSMCLKVGAAHIVSALLRRHIRRIIRSVGISDEPFPALRLHQSLIVNSREQFDIGQSTIAVPKMRTRFLPRAVMPVPAA
jgi:hypothetical protein